MSCSNIFQKRGSLNAGKAMPVCSEGKPSKGICLLAK